MAIAVNVKNEDQKSRRIRRSLTLDVDRQLFSSFKSVCTAGD